MSLHQSCNQSIVKFKCSAHGLVWQIICHTTLMDATSIKPAQDESMAAGRSRSRSLTPLIGSVSESVSRLACALPPGDRHPVDDLPQAFQAGDSYLAQPLAVIAGADEVHPDAAAGEKSGGAATAGRLYRGRKVLRGHAGGQYDPGAGQHRCDCFAVQLDLFRIPSSVQRHFRLVQVGMVRAP